MGAINYFSYIIKNNKYFSLNSVELWYVTHSDFLRYSTELYEKDFCKNLMKLWWFSSSHFFCHVDSPTTFVKTSVCDIFLFFIFFSLYSCLYIFSIYIPSFLNKTKTKPNKLKGNDQIVQLLAYFYHQEPNQIS